MKNCDQNSSIELVWKTSKSLEIFGVSFKQIVQNTLTNRLEGLKLFKLLTNRKTSEIE